MPQERRDYRQGRQETQPPNGGGRPHVSQEMPEAAIEGTSPFQQQYFQQNPERIPQGDYHGQQQIPFSGAQPQPIPPAPAPQPAQPQPDAAPAPAPKPPRPPREHRPGHFGRAVRRFVFTFLLIAVGVGGFVGGIAWERRAHPSISAASIATQLTDCADLATVKLEYNGFVHYESGDIPILNLKTFNMTYNAEVRAGVDLSQAKVSIEGHTIHISLPEATIQSSSIDPSSLQFYDQTWALLNWDSREDTTVALEQAQADLESKVDELEMINEANANAERVIKSLMAPIITMNDSYKLVVDTIA